MKEKKKKEMNKHLRRFLIFISLMMISFGVFYAYQAYELVNDGRFIKLSNLYDRSFKAREDNIYFSIKQTHVSVLSLEYRGDYLYEYVEGTFFVDVPDYGQEIFLTVMANNHLSIYLPSLNYFLYEVIT